MTCSSCGSDRSVAIQGQNYCLKCGKLLPPTPDAAAKAVTQQINAPAGPLRIDIAGPVPAAVKHLTETKPSNKTMPKPVEKYITHAQPATSPVQAHHRAEHHTWKEIKSAWDGAKMRQYYYYALAGGLLSSLVVFYFYLSDTAASGSQAKALLGLLALLIAIPAYGFKVYGSNAILFGAAKDADHRRAEKDTWYMAAINSFWPAIGLEFVLICVVIAVVTGLAFLLGIVSEFGSVQLYSVARVLSVAIVLAASVVAYLTLAYGRYLVVVAGSSIYRSVLVGLGIVRTKFKSSLVAALGALAINAAGGGLVLLVDLLTSPQSQLVGFGLMLVSVLMVTTMLIVFNQIYWLQVFRRLLPPSQRGLLSGRQPRPVRPAGAYALAGVIIALGVVATAAALDTGNLAEIYTRFGALLSD